MSLADAVAYAIAHYALDEASGGAVDSIGSRTLTENGTCGSTSGKFGNCRDFDSGSSEYFSRTSEATFVFGDENWMITAWAKLDSKSASHGVVGKFEVSDEYACYYHAGTDRLRFDNYIGSIVGNTLGSPSTGTWYLLCFGYDADNDQYRFYINGTSQGVINSSAGIVSNSGNPFLIGSIRTSLYPMNGQIDDVVLLRGRVLTSAEVTELWNGGTGVAFEDWAGGGPAVSIPVIRHHLSMQGIC